MKKTFKSFVAACFAALALTACTKDVKETAPDEVSAGALTQISQMGFSPEGVQKKPGGYLVEGDIFLRDGDLGQQPSSPNMIVAREEQYRTFNLVSASKHPVIKVALNNSSANHDAAFTAALDEAIRRYNAESLTITFQRVTSSPDVTVVAFYEVSNTLGSAGFPNTAGDPYNEVRMNTYHYDTGTDATNTNYIATIMAHELGHCIGMRHTDYMHRADSCGGRKSTEGQASNGVGAVHITGTPTTGDPTSWMLACVGTDVNRPFNTNDKVALSFIY
jgi:hypothetical protein